MKQRAGQRKFWRLDELDHCQVKPIDLLDLRKNLLMLSFNAAIASCVFPAHSLSFLFRSLSNSPHQSVVTSNPLT
jgi:hypothetical protein